MEHLEGNAAAGFEVRRLPDTAGVAVALLAFELERPWRVIDPQDKQVPLSRPQVPRQLEFERDVAAAVRAERVAVEPGGSAPVGGADDAEDAAPTRILGIELELPGAVEVLPVLPLEVGPRMLGEGDRG